MALYVEQTSTDSDLIYSTILMANASGSDIQCDREEHPKVAVNYLVVANWDAFVEQQDASLCSRRQAF